MGVAHAELANLRLSLQDVLLHDDLDVRLLKLTGKRYRRRDAYAALAPPPAVADYMVARCGTLRSQTN